MALVYLGSLFETVDYACPPERDEAKLDALAWHILDKRPKTLLGLAIRARAEKHLCRYLWAVDFERLPPSDQAARVVLEGAMLLSAAGVGGNHRGALGGVAGCPKHRRFCSEL